MRRVPPKEKRTSHTLDGFLLGKPQSDQKKLLVSKIRVPVSSGENGVFKAVSPRLKYPLNPQLRDYQLEIVTKCVCYNTLVCLPTGLGKTHIASILLSNFTTWFPEGKCFFLAPTRPLVRQQRGSLRWFHETLLENQVFEMNGNMPPQKRMEAYKSKRVIFATPQTFQNDLKNKHIEGREIVLVIFDECHRATGNYAYTQIVRLMEESRMGYRIVGLSATPGNTPQKIQEVIDNLHIAKVVCKDDTDPDVRKYIHHKRVFEVVVSTTETIKQACSLLDELLHPHIHQLIRLSLIQPWNLKHSLTFFNIREQFNAKIIYADQIQADIGYAALKTVGFILGCRKALCDQGYVTFKNQFFRQIETQQSEAVQPLSKTGKKETEIMKLSLPLKKKLADSAQYMRLKEIFSPKANCHSHPKLARLRALLADFFREASDSKVMVFTQFRRTAHQIKEHLSGCPEVKCELFHGQSKTVLFQDQYTADGDYSSTVLSVMQLKQKEQMSLIERYKKGEINTLISTSIGEEGLDIGEIDCIVCYDGGHSPIRLIQRSGRTGRQRDGKVYILLMEGKELADYKRGTAKSTKMKQMIKVGNKFNLYGFNSSLFEEHSEIPIQFYENTQGTLPISAKKIKQSRKTKRSKTEEQQRKQFEAFEVESEEGNENLTQLSSEEDIIDCSQFSDVSPLSSFGSCTVANTIGHLSQRNSLQEEVSCSLSEEMSSRSKYSWLLEPEDSEEDSRDEVVSRFLNK